MFLVQQMWCISVTVPITYSDLRQHPSCHKNGAIAPKGPTLTKEILSEMEHLAVSSCRPLHQ